jgi:hypothetical protein
MWLNGATRLLQYRLGEKVSRDRFVWLTGFPMPAVPRDDESADVVFRTVDHLLEIQT